MLARVSNIEAFRRWREDDEATVADLVRQITTDEPSEAMLAGTAFHKAMELASVGEHDELLANGYIFRVVGEIALPEIREMRAYGKYGDLTVTGQVDGIHGRLVIDHKTTSRFDADRYLAGFQWRYYLDLFGADTFQWNVFEITEEGHKTYSVRAPQALKAYRYPGLHEDCAKLAAEYLDFGRNHLPGFARAA